MNKDKMTIEINEVPFDLELEQEVLGMILVDDKLMQTVVDTVTLPMFYDKIHKAIYSAMLYLYQHNSLIDYPTVTARLLQKEGDGMPDYIVGLLDSIISVRSIDKKIEILKDIFQKRKLYEHSKKMLTSDISGLVSGDLVEQTKTVIENMGITSNIEVEKFENYIDTWVSDLENDEPIEQFKFGFAELDKLVLLKRSNLMIIGARPSVGKSAFATVLTKNFCIQKKHPLFISLEMNKGEFMNRLVANIANVKVEKFERKQDLTNDEWKRVLKAKEEVKKYKFNFYDKGGLKVEQLIGLAKYLKKRGQLDVIIIDYLQLVESNNYRGQKQNQVGFISQKLKQLAMELDIPVIALSQLSRGSIEADGKPRIPVLSDLRDSGSLEQDANIVLMLHTNDVEQKFVEKRFINLYIRKNRAGKLGKIDFEYYGDFVNFVETKWDYESKKFIPTKQEVEQEKNKLEDLPF